MSEREIIIGIDLGTTNSLVAWSDERGPRIIQSPAGERILPSVVYVDPAGRPTVGREARAHAVERPTETVFSIKRLMGKGVEDVAEELEYLPYRVVEHRASSPAMPGTASAAATGAALATDANPQPRLFPEVAHHQHGDSPGCGEQVGGETPFGAAAEAVPGRGDAMAEVDISGRRFTPQQISAMILAELKRWAEAHFGQPISKAVVTVPAYFDDAQRQATRDAGKIAGLEVLRIVNEPTAAALAYGLDRAEDATIAVYDLGGGTFDISILRIEKGVFRVLSTNGDTHLGGDDFDRQIIALVQGEVRAQFGQDIHFDPSTQQALRNFAEAVKVQLSEKPAASIEIDIGGGRTYRRTLARDEFLRLIEPLVQRSLERCELALRDAKVPADRIDRVVMVGGSTYMPHIRQRVGDFFKTEAYTALNPMEVVALGAATQAAILAGAKRDVLLLDIVPLSLGIETLGGAVAKVIVRGTHIPCQAHEKFSTFVDGQANVKIHLLQGERELVKDCRSLGQFVLAGLPPMPAGIPKIRVTFLIDANGILSVSAVEERSGQKAAIQVVPSYGLTRDEVTQFVRDSIVHARDDMLDHRLIDLRNQIQIDSAAIRKSLGIVGDQIEPAYRQELEEAMAAVAKLAESRDAEAIHAALADMDRRSARLAEMAVARILRDGAE